MPRRTGIHVRVGKNGAKTYRAEVYSARDGKKIRKSFPTEAAARQWRADAQSALSRGGMRAPAPTTVREAATAFLAGARDGSVRNRSGDRFKPSTIRSYEDALTRRLLPAVGARRLADVTAADVQAFVDLLVGEGLDASTVRNMLMPLRAIYRRACRPGGEVLVNPTRGVEVPVPRGRRDRIAAPQEASELIAALASRDRALWATAFYAGLRLGELLALRWEDVDLAAGVVRVERAYDMTAREFIEPKSKAGRRRVPIAAVLRDYLLEHKLESGRGAGLVFGRSEDLPFDYTSTMNRAKRAWRRAGAAAISLHEARHTFASLLIDADVNAKAISTFMGHSSISITIDRYGHLMPGSEDEAAVRIDAYLERANTQARLAQVYSRGPVLGQSAPLTSGSQRITADH